MVAAALAISLWTENRTSVSLQPDLGQLAKSHGPYHASAREVEDGYSDPKAEQVLSRVYQSASAPPIEVFVGYRGRQFGDERLRSPKLVFPKGWEYASMDHVEIPLGPGESIQATWLLTRKGQARKVVLYWYRIQGRSFSSDLRNRMETIGGLILRGRTDGAVVRLATPLGDFETVEQGKARLVSFALLIYPELDRVMP
jgi:EpsI family protein